MTTVGEDRRLQVALQRFEVIAPVVNKSLPRGAQKVLVDELTSKMHVDDNNQLTILGKRTIERYISNYRKYGLEGLMPQIRPEQGSLKAFSQQALDEAVKVRLARPELSADSIIEALRSIDVPTSKTMTVSTLNRHFRRLGKDRPALKRTNRKKYNLLRVEGAHSLWVCDVWDGPYLYDSPAGKNRRLRLVAIIDGYTRYIVHGEFYFNENRPCLEDTLMKGILKHNLPEIFYADNAKIFRSQHMKRIAAELGFSIKHSRPGQPQGRGRIERWFRTVAEKCEPLLKEQIQSGKITDLAGVNTFFTAWLDQRYHNRRHSTLKMSPQAAMDIAKSNHLDMSREVDAATVHEAFLWRENRDVSNLGAVKIYGNLYEVDESLVGKTVELRFNPYDLRRILVFCEGVFRCEARPYQMKLFTEKRVAERQTDSHNALGKALQSVVEEHRQEQRNRSGLSFAKALGVKHDE